MADLLSAHLVEWHEAKGYGFLRVGSRHVFVHIKDFADRRKLPEVGDLIQFSMGTDAKGRICAVNAIRVIVPGAPSARESFRPSRNHRLSPDQLVALAILLVLPVLALHQLALPAAITAVSVLSLSAITYLTYALDKVRAQSADWRIPETTLHLLAVAGGWPGAFIAQQRLRHKCAKRRFQVFFWLTVIAYQFVALDYLLQWKLSRAAWTTAAGWFPH